MPVRLAGASVARSGAGRNRCHRHQITPDQPCSIGSIAGQAWKPERDTPNESHMGLQGDRGSLRCTRTQPPLRRRTRRASPDSRRATRRERSSPAPRSPMSTERALRKEEGARKELEKNLARGLQSSGPESRTTLGFPPAPAPRERGGRRS